MKSSHHIICFNQMNQTGGAIYASAGSVLVLTSCYFAHNYAVSPHIHIHTCHIYICMYLLSSVMFALKVKRVDMVVIIHFQIYEIIINHNLSHRSVARLSPFFLLFYVFTNKTFIHIYIYIY
jgi:hypothetical protein